VNEKEGKILKAATALFSKYGPKKTTIDDIAKEARIAKGTVYIYFKSKEEIFLAVVNQEIDYLLSEMRSSVRKEKTATDKLRKFLMVRFGHRESAKERHNTTFEIMDESNSYMDLSGPTADFMDGEVRIIQEILEAGVDGGEFRRPQDIEKTSYTLSFSMMGMDMPWKIGRNKKALSTGEKVELFMDFSLNGLGV
jgi:TetR/AcrR family transcriptional regulator, fatty acid metabolism regulator protein